jgi:3-deoxy-manno-octulosonate cytidylyltransferase (CMP-KDO synthetase)
MVVRVWERVKGAQGFGRVVVATDDVRVYDVVKEAGGDAVMTSPGCRNGTERCWSVVEEGEDEDLVVNVQGDEPLMDVVIPQRLLFNLKVKPEFVWTAVRDLREGEDRSRQVVKCEVRRGFIDHFTRRKTRWGRLAHVGVYGYSVGKLREYARRKPSVEEQDEGLEQLRWRESLACFRVKYDGVGVDVPNDINKVEAILNGPATVSD